jgi:metallo-beta-lactamase family protein
MTPWCLTPLGAARTVTGSRFLLESERRRILVDCGLFQGTKDLRLRNWDPFPVDPSTLESVVITHGHLDHCGYLPRLVQAGFRGPVYVTHDTGRLMSVVLPDSARLAEEEAKFANRGGHSRHRPALPLYTEAAAWEALDLLQSSPFSDPVSVASGVDVRFEPAGHILGSASLHITLDGSTELVFSGDLGRSNHPLLRPPAPVEDADWIVVESTYGNRDHTDNEAVEKLAGVIERTVARGGSVIIPAFAVDRTELLLFHLHRLGAQRRLPNVPVYVDSPMALDALQIYRTAVDDGAIDLRPEVRSDDRLFSVSGLEAVRDAESSKRISHDAAPAVIIAGSGMATGGRVLHHLARCLPDRRHAVVLVGFQANGTRGRQLLEGATSVKIHGRYVPVRAEICDLEGFSVHADADELLDWLRTATRAPDAVFVVHGEPESASALQRRIAGELDWAAAVPAQGERLLLEVAGCAHDEARRPGDRGRIAERG